MENNRVADLKSNVPIPYYFNNVILPDIEEYYWDSNTDLNLRPVIKCPLHVENTASFRWYEDTNTFYCFGCGAGGDIIELHKRFKGNPNFNENVEFLEKLYKNYGETYTVKTKKSKQVINGNKEMILLNNELNRLEEMISYDSSIKMEQKMKLYRELDNIHILSSLGMVDALESIKYIRKVIGIR